MNRCIILSVVLLAAIPCAGKVITVDDDGQADYRSIQAALDHSWNGDTIVVRPGTYRESVRFIGRAVTVRSQDPDDPAVVQATVITDRNSSSVVFNFGEGNASVLTGFTITGRGILCDGASPTITGNVIDNCDRMGITGSNGAAPAILGNTVTGNRLEGIYGCHGLIQGNVISGNNAGVAACNGPIRDNIIQGNGPGGGLYSCNGEITGNTITGNFADSNGGGVYGCAAIIHNNIITGNRATGEGGGLYDCTKSIVNNTIVGNVAAGGGGGLSRCPDLVRNNIIAFNEAPSGAGIYGPCSNSYNAFWSNPSGHFAGGPTSGPGDVITAPLFARDGQWDRRGTADPGDDVWVDGDYHVQSQAGRWDPQSRTWVLDGATSHCIDAGHPSADWSAELWSHGQRVNLGAYGGTPQASMSLADLGHLADVDHDAHVVWSDLKRLGQRWLFDEDLLAEDLDRNGEVDLRDFAVMAASWRSGPPPTSAPLPNPMTWAVKPDATGPYSVAMVATTATSTDGTSVQYWFEDVYHPEYNSGWLSFAPDQEPRWQDTDLSPRTTYWYHVKARNTGNLVETEWSQEAHVLTLQEDSLAPAPNPMTWEVEPVASSRTSIRMVATQASDENGVEYEFQCTSHPMYSSGWRDSRTYEVASLPADHYTFKARARDKSRNQNATLFTREITVDLRAPTPDPMEWEIPPKEINIGGGSFDYYATMKAVEAHDDETDVQYYFECTTESGFSSGWQASREYTVKVGRRNQQHRFRVKARDLSPSHSETRYSAEVPAR